jgi:hypothetical protein
MQTFKGYMQALTNKSRALSSLTLVLVASGILLAGLTCTKAGESTGTIPANARGIEHVLYLAIRSDPASQLLAPAKGDAVTAKLTVKLRISTHSVETGFFGVVPATISTFDLAKGSPEQEIWRDGKCHHERGFPKISVTSVDGSIKSGQQQIPVEARWRQIGLFLPHDEVTPSKRMDGGTDSIGSYIATRTETKKSRLFVDLKLYILPCNISVAVNQ